VCLRYRFTDTLSKYPCIQSLDSDDFQQCACKRIAIDGGPNMNERRYIGSHFDFKFGQHLSHYPKSSTQTTASRFGNDSGSWWEE
jgi:hypothetical protein